jgi:hypothetical protein
MDDDLPNEPSLTGWRRSLQRIAAWMARYNRVSEPARPSYAAREVQASRSGEPSRRAIPPRP